MKTLTAFLLLSFSSLSLAQFQHFDEAESVLAPTNLS